LYSWRDPDAFATLPLPADAKPDFPPQSTPIVYQPFGHLQDAKSLVLTEDDYFNYLLKVHQLNKRPLAAITNRHLTTSCLMFLGFSIDDWDFRVLFNLLMNQQSSSFREKRPHVAVQFDPEDEREPDRARNFLEQYFEQARIGIFWGRVEDFIKEFKKRWQS
jgi:SIR2-like domain